MSFVEFPQASLRENHTLARLLKALQYQMQYIYVPSASVSRLLSEAQVRIHSLPDRSCANCSEISLIWPYPGIVPIFR